MGHRIPRGAALLLLAVTTSADERELARALQDVEQRIAEERRTWIDVRAAAASDAERAALADAFPRAEFLAELTAIADAAPGTEVAAGAWLATFRLGCLLDDRALFERSVARLTEQHLASPRMQELVLELVYGAPPWSRAAAADALRRILAETPDGGLQAAALVQLALLVGQDASFGAVGRAEARALLARIEAEHGGASFFGMTGAQFAAGARYELEHLRVGQVAPDCEAVDQDGARFALSDYRGRVEVLDSGASSE